jgi:3-hydroxy-9,10-secoandrosta-1,3,5(10)-triene-9,17-dione monooxygenase
MATSDHATPEELVERAKALIPVVRSRRTQGDEQRVLPRETVDDFLAAGFMRAATPKRFGGMEHDLEVIADVSLQVGRGDGASGWLSAFMPLHQFMVGWFSEEAQAEYWKESPDTLSSTVPGFRGMTHREEVEGGVVMSAKASFSSGVDYSDWVLMTTANETALIPKGEFTIVDDWYTAGLRGTGSKGVTFDKVFVPQHRIVSHQSLMEGTYPGAGLYESPWYKVHNPSVMILNHFILAPALGIAWGVLDIFDERAQNRTDPQTLQPATERPGPQLRYAEAHAELTAAEFFLRKNLATVRHSGELGVGLTV